ncbi:MAG: hypothetical protein AVDCRST_MAG68-1377, partial [uncultured Gemmatimonadetes bacterium]
ARDPCEPDAPGPCPVAGPAARGGPGQRLQAGAAARRLRSRVAPPAPRDAGVEPPRPARGDPRDGAGRRRAQDRGPQPARRRHAGHGGPGAGAVRPGVHRLPQRRRHGEHGGAGAQRQGVAPHLGRLPGDREHHQRRRGQPQAVPRGDASAGRGQLHPRAGGADRRVRLRPQPAGRVM